VESNWQNVFCFLTLQDLLMILRTSKKGNTKILSKAVFAHLRIRIFDGNASQETIYKLWMSLINIGQLNAQHISSYYKTIMTKCPCEREIMMDVERTYPFLEFFKNSFK
jgi:hypothetical protein